MHLRYEFFILAILLNIVSWALWGWRLQVLIRALDPTINIGLWRSTKIVIANLFLGNITPAMAGGEPLRIYLLNKDGMGVGEATAAVVGERLIDAICILIFAPFAFFLFNNRIQNQPLATGLLVGISFFILFLLIFLYALKYPIVLKKFLLFINAKISRLKKHKSEQQASKVSLIEREIDSFHSSMMFFWGPGKRTFFIVSVLTVAYWGVSFSIASMLLMGLGLQPFFIESFAAQVLLLIIVMLPTTPGGSGVVELSVSGLYSVIIGSSFGYLLGVFVLLFRLITYHMNLITGAVFQFRLVHSLTISTEELMKP